MSIIKGKYGNVEDVIIIEFGKGTLSVCNGTNEKYKSLLIREKEFAPIGQKGELNKTSDEFKPEVAIVFHNKESFDVFKEYVNNINIEYYY